MSEKSNNAREIVLSALYKMEQEGAYFNIVLKETLNRVSDTDRRFATELMYGVIKRRLTLDYIIMRLSKIKMKKMPTVKVNGKKLRCRRQTRVCTDTEPRVVLTGNTQQMECKMQLETEDERTRRDFNE